MTTIRGKAVHPSRLQKARVTIGLKGFNGCGWEIEASGPRGWVEQVLKKFVPKLKAIT
jgi:hypothetical protein